MWFYFFNFITPGRTTYTERYLILGYFFFFIILPTVNIYIFLYLYVTLSHLEANLSFRKL